MVNIIGTAGNDKLKGGGDADNIFGDPFTTGDLWGVREVGGALDSGIGGSDTLIGRDGPDGLIGDAWEIAGSGLGEMTF